MLKTLMASIREYKRAAVATPIIVTGEVVMEVAIPFVTAQLINAIQAGAGLAQLLPYAGVLVAMALASLAFGIGAGLTCSQASCGFAKNLRHDVFAAVQKFSFANIDQFSASSLVTRLTTDITNVQLAYMMIIRNRRALPAAAHLGHRHGLYHGRPHGVCLCGDRADPRLWPLQGRAHRAPDLPRGLPQVRRAQRVHRGERHRHARR